MKKILAMMLSLSLAISLVACGSSDSSTTTTTESTTTTEATTTVDEDPIKIGLVVTNWTSNSIFIEIGEQIREVAAEKGWELYEKDLLADTVVNVLENFVTIGCDIIVVQANQAPDAVASMFSTFEEKNITLVQYDTDAYKDEPCVAYTVTLENYTAGYEIGQYAAEWANENMDGHVYAGVVNRESNETFKFRAYGIIDALNEYLDDGAVYESFESPVGTNEGGAKAAEDLLSALPEMNLCVAWNGGSSVGAYEVLKAANYDGYIFSIDASADELAAIKNEDGFIAALSTNVGATLISAIEKTVEFVENGCEYPDGTTEEDTVMYFPTSIVTLDNMADYE